MRALAGIASLLLVTGCTAASTAPNATSVDIDAAAEDAQNSIANYAANRPAPAPAEPAGRPGAAIEAAAPIPSTTPAGEAPLVSDSAQDAVEVVRRYFALLGAGKYRQAWLLWGEKGTASGLSATAFESEFARYTDYRADVGMPGAIEAGAGQRYIAVAVQVEERLKAGSASRTTATVTLHRVGDIDGASEDQGRWRIRSISADPVRGTAQ